MYDLQKAFVRYLKKACVRVLTERVRVLTEGLCKYLTLVSRVLTKVLCKGVYRRLVYATYRRLV